MLLSLVSQNFGLVNRVNFYARYDYLCYKGTNMFIDWLTLSLISGVGLRLSLTSWMGLFICLTLVETKPVCLTVSKLSRRTLSASTCRETDSFNCWTSRIVSFIKFTSTVLLLLLLYDTGMKMFLRFETAAACLTASKLLRGS